MKGIKWKNAENANQRTWNIIQTLTVKVGLNIWKVGYVQKNGKWVIQVTGNLAGGKNDDKDDVSKIDTRDIYNNDLMAFFYCRDCTAELHGRDLA